MRRRSSTLASTFFLALSAAWGGCRGIAEVDNPFRRSPPSTSQVSVHITNLNFTQATIFGILQGNRQKMGIVEGGKEAVFSLSLQVPAELYMEVDFLAGPVCFTERVLVAPGDQLQITLNQGGSGLSCRSRR